MDMRPSDTTSEAQCQPSSLPCVRPVAAHTIPSPLPDLLPVPTAIALPAGQHPSWIDSAPFPLCDIPAALRRAGHSIGTVLAGNEPDPAAHARTRSHTHIGMVTCYAS